MASSEIQAFDVTVPAGTALTSPVTTDIPTGVRIVDKLFLTFPDGCAGLVGIRLTMAGVAVIPRNDGAWIKGNDRVIPYDLQHYPDSGAWQLTAYNTDLFDHTISVEFCLSQTSEAAQQITPLAASVIVTAAAVSPIPDAGVPLPPVPELPPITETPPATPPPAPAPPLPPITFTGRPIITKRKTPGPPITFRPG